MHKNRNITFLLSILIICVVIGFTNFNTTEKSIDEKLRIGISDDTSGFVINYMENKKYLKDVESEDFIEKYSILDCWANTMQWSLSSDEIDLAIICKDAAKSFVENNKDFQIVSPLVQNSDVFILNNDNPKNIGITQNKDYQEELVKKYYKNSKPVSLMGSSLVYALENNTIEGIVIDSVKSLSIDKQKISTSTKNDYDTYVLVANKAFIEKDLFNEFVDLYNGSVKELENEEVFKNQLEEYIGKSLSDKDMGDIKDWNLKFLQIK